MVLLFTARATAPRQVGLFKKRFCPSCHHFQNLLFSKCSKKKKSSSSALTSRDLEGNWVSLDVYQMYSKVAEGAVLGGAGARGGGGGVIN